MWTISSFSRDLFHTLTLAQCRFPYVSYNHETHTQTQRFRIDRKSFTTRQTRSTLATLSIHNAVFVCVFMPWLVQVYLCVCFEALTWKRNNLVKMALEVRRSSWRRFVYIYLTSGYEQTNNTKRNGLCIITSNNFISFIRSKGNIRFLCLWLWCPSDISICFGWTFFFILVVVAVSVGTYWYTDCEQHTHHDALRQCNNNNIIYQWPIRFPSEFCAINTMFGMASNFNAHFVYNIQFFFSFLFDCYLFFW